MESSIYWTHLPKEIQNEILSYVYNDPKSRAKPSIVCKLFFETIKNLPENRTFVSRIFPNAFWAKIRSADPSGISNPEWWEYGVQVAKEWKSLPSDKKTISTVTIDKTISHLSFDLKGHGLGYSLPSGGFWKTPGTLMISALDGNKNHVVGEWAKEGPLNHISNLTIYKNRGYVLGAGDSGILVYELTTGNELVQYRIPREFHQPKANQNKLDFHFGDTCGYLVPTTDNDSCDKILCFDSKNMSEQTILSVSSVGRSDSVASSCLAFDDSLIIGTKKGHVICWSPGKQNPKWRVEPNNPIPNCNIPMVHSFENGTFLCVAMSTEGDCRAHVISSTGTVKTTTAFPFAYFKDPAHRIRRIKNTTFQVLNKDTLLLSIPDHGPKLSSALKWELSTNTVKNMHGSDWSAAPHTVTVLEENKIAVHYLHKYCADKNKFMSALTHLGFIESSSAQVNRVQQILRIYDSKGFREHLISDCEDLNETLKVTHGSYGKWCVVQDSSCKTLVCRYLNL